MAARVDPHNTGPLHQSMHHFVAKAPWDADGADTGAYVVAVDAVGAGVGEVVLYATGSSARQTVQTHERPCDAVIMAIVDQWEVGGKEVWRKAAPPAPRKRPGRAAKTKR